MSEDDEEYYRRYLKRHHLAVTPLGKIIDAFAKAVIAEAARRRMRAPTLIAMSLRQRGRQWRQCGCPLCRIRARSAKA